MVLLAELDTGTTRYIEQFVSRESLDEYLERTGYELVRCAWSDEGLELSLEIVR